MKRKLNMNAAMVRLAQAELIGRRLVTINADCLRGVSGEAGEPDVGGTGVATETKSVLWGRWDGKYGDGGS